MTVGLINITSSLIWSNVDGSQNAPSGSSQYPSLLNTYTTRPPWHVAGVDYAVGSTGALNNPSITSNLPSGATFAGNNVVVSSNGVTLSNLDFTASGTKNYGLQIQSGMSGTVVTNCNFTFSPSSAIFFNGTNEDLTINYSTVNGGGTSGNSSLGYSIGCNNFNAEYCWFRNCIEDGIDTSGNNIQVKYCLFDSEMFVTGAHSDFIQVQFATTNTYSVNFCTFRQPVTGGSGPIGSFNSFLRCGDMNTGQTCVGISWAYNTMVCAGSWNSNYMIELAGNGSSGSISGALVNNNYLDAFGTTGTSPQGWCYPVSSQTNVTATFLNNINMVDGSTMITNP